MHAMLSPMRRFRLRMGLILSVLLVAPFVARGEPTVHPDWEYVRTVLLFSEHGRRIGYIERWTRPPLVAVSSTDEKYLSMVRSAIGQLNTVLAGTKMSLSLVWNEADILIYFVPRTRMQETGGRYDCRELTPRTYAFACMYGKDQGKIDFAVIVHPTDDNGIDLATSVMEELTQVLGPANDTRDALFVESLFFEPERLQPLRYKTLSPHDKKLLRFLYTHLKPGDREPEVRAAFDRYWDTIKVPK